MIPDFSLPRAQGRAVLSKLTAQRDGDNTSAILYLLDIVFPVEGATDPDDYDRLDVLVPGAAMLLRACAASPVKRRVAMRDAREGEDVFVTLDAASGAGNAVSAKSASITQASVRAFGGSASLTLRLRVRGLDPSGEGARLTEALDQDMDVTLDVAQQRLPTGSSAPAPVANGHPLPRHRGWDGSLGSVVAGEYRLLGKKLPFCGLVTDADPTGTTLYVKDGPAQDERSMLVEDVSATYHIGPTPAEVDQALDTYAEAAAAAGALASWSYLTQALGSAYADGSLVCDARGAWCLTPDVILHAVKLATPQGSA